MSEESRDPDGEFERLEAELGKLKPARLQGRFLDELRRDRQRIDDWRESTRPDRSIPGMRAALLLSGACLLMAGVLFLRYGDRIPGPATEQVADAPATTLPVGGLGAESTESRFLPVSAQGYLIEASTGGVRQSEEGPVEEMILEYRDAYHWHDPETGTNIRLFTPRTEQILVPRSLPESESSLP